MPWLPFIVLVAALGGIAYAACVLVITLKREAERRRRV